MHVIVGRIVRPHGIRGEVIVDVRTDEPEQRFTPGTALLTGTARGPAPAPPATDGRWVVPERLRLRTVRPHQGRLLVTFDEVTDRDVAEEVRGVVLWVPVADIGAPADPDEYHDHQLVGLRAVDPAGDPVGEVLRIDHAPAADLLVLRRPDGAIALVPFVAAIVPEVDVPGGRVVVDAPPGLFEL
ncbi:ribosome maturation factor RimM [Pilimelia anulata]|uniref:Ribosome maturation factor RimM n=1 Tax=Pilimelia anulata TaxID=53371 RepID=A0A8J3AYV7_9ACTN|nr:ribosome maturation factor RimM [Pilimelia anulata]GGJ76756.1 ribosome maturation factor RimM [Pilimelia anulata]